MIKTVSGNIVDLISREVFPGSLEIEDGKIRAIHRCDADVEAHYILPGFVDAHIHIESSMLIPSEFARLAVVHGTVATVSDPHEIGNVLGISGVKYMVENGKKVPFHFCFGVPSCVPATEFETSGAILTAKDVGELLTSDDFGYLSEMMNFPGVLSRDPVVMEKIGIAKSLGKPIDGHAPGLRGDEAKRYIEAGISTDHECYTLQEALDKLSYGMKILIREGSAAKNFEALHTLIDTHPEKVMFCSDDKHPNELILGHINAIVRRAVVEKKHDMMNVLRAACVNPVRHYKLDVGLLQKGDSADFIIVEDLHDFRVKSTFIKGKLVAENGKSQITSVKAEVVNHFHPYKVSNTDLEVKIKETHLHVIEALDGELITKNLIIPAKTEEGFVVPDVNNDIVKLVVINRYGIAPPAVGFIRNFKLKEGALASTIAHDSHNIVAVGVRDEEIIHAVNALMECRGGISVSSKGHVDVLPLPIAGLMSNQDGYEIAEKYSEIDAKAKMLGTTLQAPFMTLSFMALLVIPELKLSDKGLFDCKRFNFIPLGQNL